jgi:hypothetical protein
MAKRWYLVAFDLLSSGDYASLKARPDNDGSHQILEKVSAVLTAESAREIKQILRGFVDDGTASSSWKSDVTGQAGTRYSR